MAPKENSLKKIYRSEFPQSSFIFVIYLLKEVYRAKLDMRILQLRALNTRAVKNLCLVYLSITPPDLSMMLG